MLFKSCPAEVKAVGEKDGLDSGQFEAIVSVFGNKDSYGDVVQPGAFADTLAEWKASGNPIPVYYSHRMDDPDYNIGYVIDAKETDQGLWVKAQIDTDPAATKATQVHRLLKGRRLTQFSFAYDVIEGAPAKSETLGDYYSLDKLKLYEVGPTPIGANQETELLAVKSAAQVAERLAEAAKAGAELSAKNIDMLTEVSASLDTSATSIKELLARVKGESKNQEIDAQPAGPATVQEPIAKSDQATTQEPSLTSPADAYLAVISIKQKEN